MYSFRIKKLFRHVIDVLNTAFSTCNRWLADGSLGQCCLQEVGILGVCCLAALASMPVNSLLGVPSALPHHGIAMTVVAL